MDTVQTALLGLLAVWGTVTMALVCALVYRGTLQNHEEDQIFLCPGEELIAAEQRSLVARIERLSRPIKTLEIASGALLAVMAVLWGWQVFNKF